MWSLKALVDLFWLHFDSNHLQITTCALPVRELQVRVISQEEKRREEQSISVLPELSPRWVPRTRSVLPSVWTLVRLRASCSSSRSDTSSSSSGVCRKAPKGYSVSQGWPGCLCQTHPICSKGRADKHQPAPFQPALNCVEIGAAAAGKGV